MQHLVVRAIDNSRSSFPNLRHDTAMTKDLADHNTLSFPAHRRLRFGLSSTNPPRASELCRGDIQRSNRAGSRVVRRQPGTKCSRVSGIRRESSLTRFGKVKTVPGGRIQLLKRTASSNSHLPATQSAILFSLRDFSPTSLKSRPNRALSR